jgi:hypothetical protein
MSGQIKVFPHRHNQYNTWDSICTICFDTIATELTEGRLFETERTHVCFPTMEKNSYLMSGIPNTNPTGGPEGICVA